MNYSAELNWQIDKIMETHTSEVIDHQWTLYENYEILKVKELIDNSIIAFKGQVENITTKEMKQSINLYVIPNEDTHYETSMDEIWYMCSDEKYLFSKGFTKKEKFKLKRIVN